MSNILTTLPSVPELIKEYLRTALGTQLVPGGFFVGQCNLTAQEKGALTIREFGVATSEKYLPTQMNRVSVTAQATSLSDAEIMIRRCYEALHQKGRILIRQIGSGDIYLMHYSCVVSGPVRAKGESENIFELTLYAEAMFGTQPTN